MEPKELISYFEVNLSEMLEVLQELVEMETPTSSKTLNDSFAHHLADRFQAAGAHSELISKSNCGDVVRIDFHTTDSSKFEKPILILGHYDTVWSEGTLKRMPFQVNGGKAFGPGVFDMKAGLVMAEFTLRAIKKLALSPPRPITLLFTSDEETGSLHSRSIIEKLAQHAEYVLVLEPPLGNGRIKTARKGIGHFTLEIEGKSAHAGVEPHKGASAIQELAHQINRLYALNDPENGVTINVGIIRGGSRSNVVAAQASAQIDVRVWDSETAQQIEKTIFRTNPKTPGTKIMIKGGFNRPPMPRTPKTAALFKRAQSIGAELGLHLKEGATGGGSDANFTAALGIPTLDGLGAIGSGAHAEHEHIHLDSWHLRTALLTALILGL